MSGYDWEYGWPSAAYLLLLLFPFAVLFWRLYVYRRRVLASFAAEHSLGKILVPRSRLFYIVGALALLLSFAAAILALMDPRGNGRYLVLDSQQNKQQPKYKLLELTDEEASIKKQRKAHDVIFLLDASASMQVADTRSSESRLDYAKEIVDQLASLLSGEQVALYVFTAETTPVVPSTLDYFYLRLMLRGVKINEGDVAGTDISEALEVVRQRHFNKQNELKTVILLSDGGDTHLESLQGEERTNALNAMLALLGDPEASQVRLFTVGMGSLQGAIIPGIDFEGKSVRSTLDEGLLTRLSEIGRGRYYFANNFSAPAIAKDIFELMKQDSPHESEVEEKQRVGRVERLSHADQQMVFDLYFQIPLAFALLFLAAALLLPEVRKAL